jgi:acyl-CoA synthetase (AMP-forming)/AMP-acid ligase II
MHHEFFSGPVPQQLRRAVGVARQYGRRALRAAGRQTWLTPIPFHTIGGNELLVTALLSRHTLVTMPAFHPRRAMELLDRERVNVFPVTPSMVETMVDLKDFDRFDLSSLLVVGLGSAPARPELVRRAQMRFGCSVTVGYGSTELGGGVLVTRIDDPDDVKSETVGRPFPGADIRIVDEEGQPVPEGEPGELLCRVESVMARYVVSGPEATGIEDSVDNDGWYHTNDVAVRDSAGNVRILGRRDDLIIRGGHKVRPAEVEQVLAAGAGVRQVAVVGVDEARMGQQVWAFVVPEPSVDVDRVALLAHCRAHLAPQKVPDHIRACDALPTTALGKVQRHRLAELARAELAPTGDL